LLCRNPNSLGPDALLVDEDERQQSAKSGLAPVMLPNVTIGLILPVTDYGDQSYRGPKQPVSRA
jgi:hypothetical protein